jgi:hypothetical protein
MVLFDLFLKTAAIVRVKEAEYFRRKQRVPIVGVVKPARGPPAQEQVFMDGQRPITSPMSPLIARVSFLSFYRLTEHPGKLA